MYVEARIQIDNYKTNALPNEAVVSNGDEHYIYVETKKNHYTQIAVKIGVSDMGFTEILPLEEIPGNAKVVTKGAYYLLSQLTKGIQLFKLLLTANIIDIGGGQLKVRVFGKK